MLIVTWSPVLDDTNLNEFDCEFTASTRSWKQSEQHDEDFLLTIRAPLIK